MIKNIFYLVNSQNPHKFTGIVLISAYGLKKKCFCEVFLRICEVKMKVPRFKHKPLISEEWATKQKKSSDHFIKHKPLMSVFHDIANFVVV